MSFTWSLNTTYHDLSITDGKLNTVYGADEVKQRILVTLWHYWEEYFLNVPAGVPWYELILGSKDRKMVESLLRRAILDVPGVISIVQFKIQIQENTLRDFAIFAEVEVEGGYISILTTPPAEQPVATQYITTEYDAILTTEYDGYLEA